MKKLLSLVLSLSLLLSVSGYAFEDTKDSPYEREIQLLHDLGLVSGTDEANFSPDNNLTKAEMTVIILRMLAIENASSGRNIFTDVPSEHWAYKSITAAYDLGIVNGTGDSFKPDSPVTFAEAVKMTVCALGYGIPAESLGGYPSGYLSKASAIGILKGISRGDSSEITRGQMCRLVANALDAELLERQNYGASTYTFDTKGETVLSAYLKIDKYEGQITDTYYASMNNVSMKKGYVSLSGKDFYEGGTGASAYIGQKVTIYTAETDGRETILHIAPDKQVRVITVNDKDILDKTTSEYLWYDGESRELSERIGGARVIYNGVGVSAWTRDTVMPLSGTVTLISNTGTDADVIIVDAYENHVIDKVIADKDTIYFKDGTAVTVDSSKMQLLMADGKEAKLEDLFEWDIVSLSQSAGKTKLVVSQSMVSGTVTEVSDDSIRLDDTLYKTDENFSAEGLLGLFVNCYTDHRGYIAAADNERNYFYGYLAGCEETKSLEPVQRIKVFTEQGEMKVYEFYDFIIFNGSTLAKDKLFASDNAIFEGGAAVRQLIRYTLGDDGERISGIETATDYREDMDNPQRETEFGLVYYIDGNRIAFGEDVFYIGGSTHSFGARFLMRDKTKIFVIPAADAEDDEYFIKDRDTMSTSNEGERYTNVSLYDCDKNQVVAAMVWDVGSSSVSADRYLGQTDPVAVVSGISKAMDKDGNSIYNITVMNQGAKTITLEAEEDFECLFKEACTDVQRDPVCTNKVKPDKISPGALKTGDVIQYKEQVGKAKTISVMLRADTPGDYESGTLNGKLMVTSAQRIYMGNIFRGYGTVLSAGEYGVLVRANQYSAALDGPSGKTFEHVYAAAPVIVLFDTVKKTCERITVSDVREGDRVLHMAASYSPRMWVVYR